VPCWLQWGNGNFAPGIKYGDEGKYACGHNLLLAHGQTKALYDEKYRAKQVRGALAADHCRLQQCMPLQCTLYTCVGGGGTQGETRK